LGDVRLSVIFPTHTRPEKLAILLGCLRHQDLAAAEYEIIVVDDNSVPPVALPPSVEDPRVTLVRLDDIERSAARNTGATAAAGEWLVFLDDDMTVEENFLSCHLSAHMTWPNTLVVGSIRLPDETALTAFGRFRQRLEDQGLPQKPGLVSMPNFCTAANMSLSRKLFLETGGFDGTIVSSEDQDFALRHTSGGGRIAFLPEANAIHRDDALDIRSYCRRAEWGSLHMMPFCRRYPDWRDNVERDRVNGPVRLSAPISETARKVVKVALTLRPVAALLFRAASVLERAAPNSRALDRVYRLLLGIHIFRGYRRGLTLSASSNQRSAIRDQPLTADR